MTDRLRLRMKLRRYGKEYTFTHISLADPTDSEDAALDAAYKTKIPTETTFREWAFVEPARAYAIHSNVQILQREGGLEDAGIIVVELADNTAVVDEDFITTPEGKYKLMAIETYNEFKLYEGHKV